MLEDLENFSPDTPIVGEAFPDFKQRVLCFSYDWLGRHFALDFRRLEGDQYLVLMLEPGTGQALEIPATFRDFHERELIEFRSEALASDFYQSWLSSGRPQPNLSECVGYRKPLFLGGEDVLNNLELVDMEVYWSVCGQLLARVRRMPEGSSIRNIRIEDKI